MCISAVPRLCTKAMCIADDPALAATISSFFNEKGEYLCLLDAPRMSRPDHANEVVRRNNVAARLQPDRIIVAGLDKPALAALRSYFSPTIRMEIESVHQLEDKLKAFNSFQHGSEVTCNCREIGYGLLLAKRAKARLRVDDSAPCLEHGARASLSNSGHVVFVEESDDLVPVIAANYAYSINAGLQIIPPVGKTDVDHVYDELLYRSAFRGTTRGQEAHETLQQRAATYEGGMGGTRLRFATFITRGIPYGYFFPDFPSTHLFSYPDLGLQLFAGIFHASRIKSTRSAVLLDPGDFEDTETELIRGNLGTKGVRVKTLKGDAARVYNVRNHIQYYPYDLLYICSHARVMDGRRLKIRFNDSNGNPHLIVVDHAAGFAPNGEGSGVQAKIEVLDFIRFVELDGAEWGHNEAKGKIGSGAVMQDFMKISTLKWDVIEGEDIPYVRDCVALKMTDHYCLMLFHAIADGELPVVFNNACSSLYNFAQVFLFAGARAYVGTVAPVDNSVAKRVGEEVFRHLGDGKTLPLALWEAQRNICPDWRDRSYVHVGCDKSYILSPDFKVSDYIDLRLQTALARWMDKRKQVLPDDVRRNVDEAIKFLNSQLRDR